ncbi:MAG: TRC40/GET3/ArsA family transport-energizing ATPase [Chloroflexota bacterium]|nr:TRC40/GET3/ArsA family transport-energizing ATPase [Chloroflexota bacterium]
MTQAKLLIVGGKGGVGKTTIAAATALGAAERGQRCLVASVDRAHSLGDVLGQQLGPAPAAVAGVENLWALEVDPQAELRRHWGALQSYVGRILAYLGIGGAVAEEVAVLPGLEELLVLARLSELVSSGDFDLHVADFAPTASSLRYLSFPSLVGGSLGKWIEWDRRIARLLRPLEGRYMRMPVPEERVYTAITQLADSLATLQELLADPQRTGVRLVMVPEPVILAETRRALTYLSLFGLNVDVVVANRVLPAEADLGYLAGWSAVQARVLEETREAIGGLQLLTLLMQPHEIVGAASLRGLASDLYGDRDPSLLYRSEPALSFGQEANDLILSFHLPHASDAELDLRRREDELILTVGGWRRTVLLPDSFVGRPVVKAALSGSRLRIVFGGRAPAAADVAAAADGSASEKEERA